MHGLGMNSPYILIEIIRYILSKYDVHFPYTSWDKSSM